jgi:hypothetical protein
MSNQEQEVDTNGVSLAQPNKLSPFWYQWDSVAFDSCMVVYDGNRIMGEALLCNPVGGKNGFYIHWLPASGRPTHIQDEWYETGEEAALAMIAELATTERLHSAADKQPNGDTK